jgi:peptide/nickel transport system substrate-binding protein
MMKALDSAALRRPSHHLEPVRPTSRNMIQDTLVALDWDGKTAVPLLAKSWTISPDGKLYTFKLRDDVQFCSGKKFTAADVVYSFNRQKDPATKRALCLARGQDQGTARPRPLHGASTS